MPPAIMASREYTHRYTHTFSHQERAWFKSRSYFACKHGVFSQSRSHINVMDHQHDVVNDYVSRNEFKDEKTNVSKILLMTTASHQTFSSQFWCSSDQTDTFTTHDQ